MENFINIVSFLLGVAFVFFCFYIVWKFYTKTGRPGWGALVPIYNMYLLVKIAGRPGWWTILLFIPIVNLVITIIISIDTAAAFKRSAMFGIFGLFLFSIIGYAMLAFGDDEYTQPVNE